MKPQSRRRIFGYQLLLSVGESCWMRSLQERSVLASVCDAIAAPVRLHLTCKSSCVAWGRRWWVGVVRPCVLGSRWLSGIHTRLWRPADDAATRVQLPGATLSTGFHPFGVGEIWINYSKQWVAAVGNCRCRCSRCGSVLKGIKRVGLQVTRCDPIIKHGPYPSPIRSLTVSGMASLKLSICASLPKHLTYREWWLLYYNTGILMSLIAGLPEANYSKISSPGNSTARLTPGEKVERLFFVHAIKCIGL